MIRGRATFDGLALGEGSFSFLGSAVHLEGKAAFVNTRSGDTHGWTKNTQWSPAVIAKLKELRLLMEQDLGLLHIENGGELIQAGGPARQAAPSPSTGGLGEHFNDIPQI